MDLVLASGSVFRRDQLSRLGLPFEAMEAGVDEEALKGRLGAADPVALAVALAEAKALSRAGPGRTVIGGDQLAALDGRILGKPGSPAAAADQLRDLAGRTHELITAIAVWHDGAMRTHVDAARLTMRPFDQAAIARYLAADEPWDCAGAYKLEQRGITLFERIECDDHSAITGLPLIALTTILRDLGFDVP